METLVDQWRDYMGNSNKKRQAPEETAFDCTRRDFVKWSAALGGMAALTSGGLSLGLRAAKAAEKQADGGEKMFWTSCIVNCGAACPLRAFVRNGRIVRVETDNVGDDTETRQVRCCLRGRAMRQLVYSPDRIKYPMKRVGKRGEGKFERITWDEAYTIIAGELKRVYDTYGPEAVYRQYASGHTSATVNRRGEIHRLLNLLGGYLDYYGTYSAAQIVAATPYTYGQRGSNSIGDIANSRLAVFFGNNPIETRASGGGPSNDLLNALKKSNARVIIFDPRFSDTAAMFAHEWVPIRPGTDAAVISAMAHVMITENLVDKEFIDKYSIGYDRENMPEGVPPEESYKDYILGTGPDMTPKTPEWASGICGCPPETITRVAREIASTKPAYIVQGLGPQRSANGEQTARAVMMLPILTGNVGIRGGNTGDQESGRRPPWPTLPTGKNPVKTRISVFTWDQAIEDGPGMTALNAGVRGKDKLDVGIKFIWNNAGNTMINQHSDINRTKKLLEDEKKLEFLLVIENRMTSSAMFADILLPSTYPAEEDELFKNGTAPCMGQVIVGPRAIKPVFDTKTNYEICVGVAEKLGLKDKYTEGRTQWQWVEFLYKKWREIRPQLPEDINEAVKHGLYKWEIPPGVAFQKFREDPEANPLKTPSGKIEIFSEKLWKVSKTWELPEGDVITATPQYTKTWEGPEDPLREKFPLQLIGHHFKGRVHSTFANLPWLMRVAPQTLWMNPLDAERRGLQHGDTVKIFNDRGATLAPVKVTPRIMPGVVSLPQGAWYKANAKGVDTGGCVNTVTKVHPSPLAKGNPQHTNLVEVAKA